MNTGRRSKSRKKKEGSREQSWRRSLPNERLSSLSRCDGEYDHAQGGTGRRNSAGRSGRSRRCQSQQEMGGGSLQAAGVSGTSNDHQSGSTGSDIPGYYYDPEKKLYFKIQSYNLGSVAPFVTKDKIVSKQREHQRMLDIEKLTNKQLPQSTAQARSNIRTSNDHIVNMLRNFQCGQFTSENLRLHMIRHVCSRIQPHAKWENSLPGQPSLHLGEIQKMEVGKRRDKILCISSLKSSYSQIIQLMAVEEQPADQDEHRCTTLRVVVPFLAQGPIHKRIKTLCWAPMKQRPGQPIVLYTTVCPIGCLASIVYLSNIQAENDDDQILFESNLGKSIIWSSAWSSRKQHFTVGADRKCYLTDVVSRKQWTFNTLNSDSLSQLFSTSGTNIYNGTRNGHILLHDMRTQNWAKNVMMMKQEPGVGCLRRLRDDNYLMASDFSGVICMWDQRVRKKVMEYKKLTNSHWQLPFYVDETESLLTSTGSDSYTKIWDLRSGNILCSIPPPYPASTDCFPVSFYSSRWADRGGNAALLVAMRNSFSFYKYREADQ